VDDIAAAEPARSVRRAISAGVVAAVSGAVLGTCALVVAVLSVIAGEDRAVFWMCAALLFPTSGCAIAWSRLDAGWSRSSVRVRYYALRSSRSFTLVRTVCGFWTLLSQIIVVGALVWLVMRLVDGATGWLWLAIAFVVGAGLAALSVTLTVLFDGREQAFHTFDMVKWVTDGFVEKELANSPYRGGSPDWNSFWLHRIRYYKEDPPVDRPASDCVDYIIAARAAAGLPPLYGARGVFLVDGHDLGVAVDSVITVRGRVLDADLIAAEVPARAEAWALAPPRLYFHGLDISDSDPHGRIVIDDARLEDFDIAFYLGEHLDVYGTLVVEETRLHFSGEVVPAIDDRWPVEIEVAFEPA
jgi:hypothetical protein